MRNDRGSELCAAAHSGMPSTRTCSESDRRRPRHLLRCPHGLVRKTKFMKTASCLPTLALSSVTRFTVLLGMLLGSHVLAVAQTTAPRSVPGQERVASTMTMLRTVSSHLPAASLVLSQAPAESTVDFSFPFAGAYGREYTLKDLFPIEEFRTSLLTQSSLTLVQLWGGRIQLGAFKSTLHIQNMQLVGNGSMQSSRLLRQICSGEPTSVNFSGLSLSFYFGREARTEHPVQLWQRVTRMAGAVLN